MKRNEFVMTTLVLGGIIFVPAVHADVQAKHNIRIAQAIKKDMSFSQDSCSGAREGFMSDLTDSQLEKMVSLRDRFHVATAAKEAELKSIFHQIAAQLAAPTIDKKALGDLHSRAAKLHEEISDEHLKLMTNTAEILTAEQRQKMYNQMLKHLAAPGPLQMPPPFMGPLMHGFPGPPNMMLFGPGGFPPPMRGHRPDGFGPPEFRMPPDRP